MTLVYRSSKQKVTKPLHDLGPGAYNIDANATETSKKKNSSMFLSCLQRDPFELNKQLKQNQKAILKPNKNNNSEQQITTYHEPFQNIINQKKAYDCTSVFNSNVQRFKQKCLRTNLSSQKAKQVLLAEQFKKILLNKHQKENKGKILKIKDKTQIQNTLNQKCQFFPSIPTWQNSYGYKQDPKTNKWVANQNPKVLLMMKERQRQQKKINCAMGPGYYLIKNLDNANYLNQKKESLENKALTVPVLRPNVKPQTPIHNSIQQDQNKMKMRIRFLGKSNMDVAEDFMKQNRSTFFIQNNKITGTNTRQVLINKQILKTWGQFIPKQERKQAQKYIQKVKEDKMKQLKQKYKKLQQKQSKKDNKQTELNQTQNVELQYFLTKSKRFDSNDSFFNNGCDTSKAFNQNYIVQEAISPMIKKSYNRKQTLLLGQKRFNEIKDKKQNLGPGKYNTDCLNMSGKKAKNPYLKNTQQRFHQTEINRNSPAPGDYNVAQNIIKEQKQLGQVYKKYKQHQSQQIKKNFKREDSMESLYQNWGRQMNYIAKLQHQEKTKQNQSFIQSKKAQKPSNSLVKIKKQLKSSLQKIDTSQKQFNFADNNREQSPHKLSSNVKLGSVSSIVQKNRNKKEQNGKQKVNKKKQFLLHSKIYKHSQNTGNKTQQSMQSKNSDRINEKVQNNLGPGSYQIRGQMVKKTFNCTYD